MKVKILKINFWQFSSTKGWKKGRKLAEQERGKQRMKRGRNAKTEDEKEKLMWRRNLKRTDDINLC